MLITQINRISFDTSKLDFTKSSGLRDEKILSEKEFNLQENLKKSWIFKIYTIKLRSRMYFDFYRLLKFLLSIYSTRKK